MATPADREMIEDHEEYDHEEETSEPPGANDDYGAEEAEYGTADQDQNSPDPEIKVGKPQVWIRIRPTPSFDNNVFEVDEDGKTLRLNVEPEDRIFQKKTGKTASFKFPTDGILQSVSQDETFQAVVQEVVEKAMDGITGAVVFVGPEISGKSFTLFGPLSKYQFRGVLPRALEKIFEIADIKKDEMDYRVILSMFEIRKNRIKDLLTLGPYELRRVGDYGPKGLFYEEITSIEQALGLILRGICGQKMLPREIYAKYHTIIYLDIIGHPLNEDDAGGGDWRSRITFAKIASMPNRDKPKNYPLADPNPECRCPEGCYEHPKYKNDIAEDEEPQVKCCRGSGGKMSEAISIRKDMSFLEQMFIRSHDLRKINEYYQKLQSLGMYMLMKPPKLAPSQYFRQSKLAHCLKDVVSGKTEIRVILHVRPERAYLQSTLEAMRFAQRARCVPCDVPKKANSSECQSFEQKIANMCQELGISDQFSKGPVELLSLNAQISPDKMREVLAQATAYFEEKLDSLEGTCKEQVKVMFEAFREMWTHMLEKDWAEGEAKKSQDPPPEVPVETVDAGQTTEEPNLEDENPSNAKRKSSSSKKKPVLKDKEGLGGGVNTKSKGDRRKKKKGRKSSVSKQKSQDNQDGKESASSHGSQHDSTGNHKGSVDPGPEEQAVQGESEGEAEQSAHHPVQNVPPAAKKSLEPDQRKKVEEPSLTVPPSNSPVVGAHASNRKSKPKAHQEPGASSVAKTQVTSTKRVAAASGNGGPFQHEAWESFSKSSPLVEEFIGKQSLLRKCILDHNETQKEVSNHLAGLTQLQMDLDIMQQERYSKGSELDADGNAVVSTAEQGIIDQIQSFRTTRDELVTRLKDLREQLHSQQRLVQESKMECERAFLVFCSETYGKTVDTNNLPLSTLDDAVATTAQEALGFGTPQGPLTPEGDINIMVTSTMSPDEREQAIAGHFEDLKRIAKRQAQALLQAYPKRPPWSTSY